MLHFLFLGISGSLLLLRCCSGGCSPAFGWSILEIEFNPTTDVLGLVLTAAAVTTINSLSAIMVAVVSEAGASVLVAVVGVIVDVDDDDDDEDDDDADVGESLFELNIGPFD